MQMKKYLPKLFALFIFVFSVFVFCGGLSINNVYSQDQAILPGLGASVQIAGDNIEDGHIICNNGPEGYAICAKDYDTSMFGVVNLVPAAAFESTAEGYYIVVHDGNANVKVNTVNGNIAEGDLVTTSQVPGIGQK